MKSQFNDFRTFNRLDDQQLALEARSEARDRFMPANEPRPGRRWNQTYTGRRFCILDPRADDVCIEDIAAVLSRAQQGGGHYRYGYTIAQHSVFVSKLVPSLAALLHDAGQAYTGFVATAVKDACPELQAIERRVQAAIGQRFGIEAFDTPEIVHANAVALATERRDLTGENAMSWGPLPDPAAEPIRSWHSEWYVKECFMARFRDLSKGGAL